MEENKKKEFAGRKEAAREENQNLSEESASGPKVKICGITRPEEAAYLNEAGADYAGFVFYPPSRRNISFEKAAEITPRLKKSIRRVAVTVSPGRELAEKIEGAGFDIIQIHKNLSRSLLEAVNLPVWYAFNIGKTEEIEKQEAIFASLPEELDRKIEGIVIDGADFGSGKTFEWAGAKKRWQSSPLFKDRKLILAGGLTAENVAEGIRIFGPDVVDVSSGVEIKSTEAFAGKDKEKILDFCRQAKTEADFSLQAKAETYKKTGHK